MVFISKLAGVAAAACFASTVLGHSGEHHDHQAIKREVKLRNQMASAAKRSIDSCSGSLKHREVSARSVKRRAAVARDIRQKRNIKACKSMAHFYLNQTTLTSITCVVPQKFRRDLATLEIYEAIDHNETGVYNYTSSTAETTVFSANTSCILTPLVTDGPYYVTGEQIRKNVTEGQAGIPLYLEVQYLDISTCLPVPDIYVDIWNANSTGVYG